MKLKKHFLLFLFSILLFSSALDVNSQVLINEYSCSNVTTIADNFGNSPDWIELYNSGTTTINLAGYHLSDKISNPTKWTIPSGVSIASNGFLIIWASGANTVVSGNVHAGFKLTQTKLEAIVFAGPSGTIIDSLTLKPTLTDHSRGRTTNGASAWGVFTTPTPGTSNSGAKLEYAARPSMNLPSGFYTSSQTVTITSSGTGLTIYYTTDGSVPTNTSSIYSSPVTISSSIVLRARAFSSDLLVPASFVESNSYFINVTHTVAVVSVFGDQLSSLMAGGYLSPEAGLEYFNANMVQKAESEGTADKHGNDSWAYNQRGIDFVSKDEFGYNYAVNTKLFVNKPRDSFQKIILKAAANDNYPDGTGGLNGPANIRDSYVHTLSQRGNMHLDERTWSPCVLYVNGQYWGVYDIREKVDDSDFTDYYSNQPEENLQFLMTWGSTWSQYGGTQAQTDWDALRLFITSNSMANQANYNHVDSLFNVKSLADYIILNSWAVTSDWLNWNTGWWRGLNTSGSEKKWRYILWDNDATFGHYINYTGVPSQAPNADPCAPESLPDPGGQGHIEILNALLNNPGFKQYYLTHYIDLLNSTLSCNYAVPLLDSMIAVIQPEMPGHIARWGGTMADWQQNVTALRDYIFQRCVAINQGMTGCYQLTGPFNITYDVQPVASGKIQINSYTPSSYIYSGSYFGNILTTLKAKPATGFVFDHWEFQNHVPMPSATSDSVVVTYSQSDSVIAVFRSTGPYIIKYNVEPIASGNININGTVPTSYIYSGSSLANIQNTLKAFPTTGYVFDHWEFQHHTPLPLAISDSVVVTYSQNDSVIAVFRPSGPFVITYDAQPLGSGNIKINGFIPSSYIYSESSFGNIQNSLKAFPISGYVFDHWEFQHHTPLPSGSSDSVVVTYSQNDSVIAVFLFVEIPTPAGFQSLGVPTAFSPNGDNNNDVLYVLGSIKSLNFEIFNRWGQSVFKTTDPSIGWDGSFNGKKLDPGVFAYQLSCEMINGDKIEKKGNITLVR